MNYLEKGYQYETEKNLYLFTEAGQRNFLKTRDRIKALLEKSGAITMGHAMCAGASSWEQMMYVDRMVELGELEELKHTKYTAGQHRIFITPRHGC